MGSRRDSRSLQTWLQYGRMPWKNLFQPAISLAKDGFIYSMHAAERSKRNKALLVCLNARMLLDELIPNVVYYENWTVIHGDHIELSDDRKKFLRERGHVLQSKIRWTILKGMLTAISDPRKDGRPAAY
ncbi:gamma-glutamyltranspeptidase 1 [Artemisia annua]|uniref:Gamma-glutamyltranspeptidase 1 n=1 Tax=Artemisia annua TaxID=35608 RepID=A0A2U1MUD3_ARTAN|nr:gamma-glutamyltranspeptidase 1 [Artemisia annua]